MRENIGELELDEHGVRLAPLRELSVEELSEIVVAHKKWLTSAKQAGKRAELNRVNLQRAELGEVDLSEADLQSADLRNANLRNTNLQQANLSAVRFQGAILYHAKLSNSDLQNADLQETQGLIVEQLAGANLAYAAVPAVIAKFDGLANISEISKNAQTLFLTMLLVCVYAWLTIAATTDGPLLSNSATSHLPVIGTTIPIVGFYWAAPLFLIGLYIYFHLCLQYFWDELAALPAIFPNGRTLDRNIPPWLLNSLVSANFIQLKRYRPKLFRLQLAISIFFTWWIAPITVLLFWLRYLCRHDWVGTALHATLFVVASVSAIFFYQLAKKTLQHKQSQNNLEHSYPVHEFLRRNWQFALIVPVLSLCLFFISYGAINGVPSERYQSQPIQLTTRAKPPDLSAINIRRIVPRVLTFLGFPPFANFIEQDLSTRPQNWTGRNTPEELDMVRGAYFMHLDLAYAEGTGAFLAKADLRDVNLFQANLRESDLPGAYLADANMLGVNLTAGNLRGAILFQTNLENAELTNADLQNTQLREANFHNAGLAFAELMNAELHDTNLEDADLQGSNLTGADIENARFTRANLQGAKLIDVTNAMSNQIRQAHNWQLAFYSADMLEHLALPSDHNDRITNKDFVDADLTNADLIRARLFGFNFTNAKLIGADLRSADLRGTTGLTRAQLQTAIIDDKTLLPDGLERN